MTRRLFNLAAALSLLLFVATCTLWVRSYWVSDGLRWYRTDGQRTMRTRQGYLALNLLLADHSNQPADYYGLRYQRDVPGPPQSELIWRLFIYPDPSAQVFDWEHGGFVWYTRRRYDGVRYVTAIAPFWSLAALAAVPPLAWAALRRRARRRRRSRPGLCPTCGYDLRESPARCPECGTFRPLAGTSG